MNFLRIEKNTDLVNLFKTSAFVMLTTILLSLIFRGSLSFAFVDRIFLSLIFFQVIISNIYYEQYRLKDNVVIDLIIYIVPMIYFLLWVNFSKYSDWWIPYQNVFFKF